MKQKLLLIISFIYLTGTCQSQSTSPLIRLINSDYKFLNFNEITNFKNYENTKEKDLERKIDFRYIVLSTQNPESKYIELPADLLVVDNESFICEGSSKIKSLGYKSLILEKDTVFDSELVLIEENYIIRKMSDTVTRYSNKYYSFLKNGIIVFEAFDKNRIWKGNLNQTFVGVSINKIHENPPIILTLSPNPATSICTIQFDLFKEGNVIIEIVNQDATFHSKILNEKLDVGNNSITFSVKELITGTYTVFLQFEKAIYSSNLIIQ